jgi:tRNA pseudouridine13 synthase
VPGEEIPGVETLQGDGWRVIESNRHLKKLKTGALAGNKFTLVVRDISDCDAVESALHRVKSSGVPNYFGPQRFGHQGQNLMRAEAVLLNGLRVKDRFLRGIYYSAARSFLFNRILSARVAQHSWNTALSGDVMQLAGKNSIFTIEMPDDTIHNRLAEKDISPASSLWGKGEERVSLDARLVQQEALCGFEPWCTSLEAQGLERAYRAHVLRVQELTWVWDGRNLELKFELVAGAYATSVLREIIRS